MIAAYLPITQILKYEGVAWERRYISNLLFIWLKKVIKENYFLIFWSAFEGLLGL